MYKFLRVRCARRALRRRRPIYGSIVPQVRDGWNGKRRRRRRGPNKSELEVSLGTERGGLIEALTAILSFLRPRSRGENRAAGRK